MSKPELGVKRDCPECGARFYDLNKEPAHCPKCHHEFIPEALLKPRKTRAADEPAKDSDDDKEEKPDVETSLEDAEAESKAPESKRKAGLDDDDDDTGDDIDAELAEFEDVDVDDDADDNTTILDDGGNESDVAAGVVANKVGDDEL